MFGRCHDIAASERTELDLRSEATQTNLARLWCSAQLRIARLTDVSAFGLAAGRKPANGRPPFPSAFLARNMNPRKANDWFRKSPRRFASLQYTTFVFCGCSTNLQAAKRSASALHSACASSALLQ